MKTVRFRSKLNTSMQKGLGRKYAVLRRTEKKENYLWRKPLIPNILHIVPKLITFN